MTITLCYKFKTTPKVKQGISTLVTYRPLKYSSMALSHNCFFGDNTKYDWSIKPIISSLMFPYPEGSQWGLISTDGVALPSHDPLMTSSYGSVSSSLCLSHTLLFCSKIRPMVATSTKSRWLNLQEIIRVYNNQVWHTQWRHYNKNGWIYMDNYGKKNFKWSYLSQERKYPALTRPYTWFNYQSLSHHI